LVGIFILSPQVRAIDLPSESGAQRELILNIDWIFTDFNYDEPGVMSEEGQFPFGLRGQALFKFNTEFGVSIGGYGYAGNLTYNGSTFSGDPITVETEDWVREERILAHLIQNQLQLAFGVARRTWFNDLVISYTRTTTYTYFPAIIKVDADQLYTSFEYRFWGVGKNVSTLSDVSASRNDIELTQNEGFGYAVEVGFRFPIGQFQSRVFFNYDYWKVDQSDVQFDGVDFLVEPDNNSHIYTFGAGLIF